MGNQGSAHGHRARKNVHWRSAEAPQPPGRPRATCGEGSEGREGRLRWAPPPHDGGASIQGYMVECNRVGSPLWVRTNPPLVLGPELILAGLDAGFGYRFRVCAQNAVGVSQPSSISDILYVTASTNVGPAPPKFRLGIADTDSMENEKTEFKVYFDGDPTPTVAWFKDGFEIFSSRRTAILNEDDRSTLIFHQTSLNDEGEIKCTLTNRAGHAVSRARLRLQAAPRVRLPRRYEDGLLFDAGETVLLKVSIVGKPIPIVQWTHDGKDIVDDERITVTHGDKFSTLRLINANREDRGEYQIVARNDIGEDAASFLVTITAKPDPPKEVKATLQGERSALVSWVSPEDDGGCQISSYIVEYYRTGWNVWLKATAERKLCTTLVDLIEGSEYKFRVKAESPYGVSEPSMETNSINIPGKSSNVGSSSFLEKLQEEQEKQAQEEQPMVVPRRKRQSSPLEDESKHDVTMVKHRNLDPSINTKSDRMRYGSSEFMLILYPDGEKSDEAEKRKSFQLDLEDAMSPPSLSLSAPQLGANLCFIQPLRNSVSSTELLHEHAMNRVYQVMALKEAEKAKAKKDYITNDVSFSDIREKSPMKNNQPPEKVTEFERKPALEPEIVFKPEPNLNTKESVEQEEVKTVELTEARSDDSLNVEENSLFEDDYTTSTVSTGDSEYSDSDSLEDGRIRNEFDENNTYHPKEMVPKGIPKEQNQAIKPVPLPDPNFIPKPILKKRTPVKTEVKEEKKDEKPKDVIEKPKKVVEKTKSSLMSKVPLLKNITKSPLEKFINSNKNDSKAKNNLVKVNNKQMLAPVEDKKDKSPEVNMDGNHLMAERYGNIIKEVSSKRQQPMIYKSTEEMKKAVLEQETKEKTETEKKPPKKIIPQKKPVQVKPKSEVVAPEKPTRPKKKIVKESVNNTTIQTVSLPKNFSELNAEAESNVRNAFSYVINIFMVLVAFWLYVFKSEFLAIPFLALAIYREVHETLKNNIPPWIKNRISSK